jgi:hypothetical protein
MAICRDGLIRSAFPSADDTAGPERPSRVELSILARMDSELLGFASDARVLILNCDDLGMHAAGVGIGSIRAAILFSGGVPATGVGRRYGRPLWTFRTPQAAQGAGNRARNSAFVEAAEIELSSRHAKVRRGGHGRVFL